MKAWYELSNVADVPSPALLVYPDRAAENIRRMVALVGDVGRLRPHVKTHKLPQVVGLQLDAGIRAFKAATIAECEVVAAAGGPDVLLAYQPVGPNVERLLALVRKFGATRFSAVVDDASAAAAIARTFAGAGERIVLLVDLDCGMHRTGVPPGPDAEALYGRLATLQGVEPGGLHAYDGHLRQGDLAERTIACDEAMAPVRDLRDRLVRSGLPVPRMVAGGTPTFPIHASRPDVECSPGTCVFWDAGYARALPDLDFLYAAVLMTRVVSRPGGSRLCLDLGHKAVASENPHPRVVFPDVPDAVAVGHSEEHLVIETSKAGDLAVGDVLYGIPWHICPTVALHDRAIVVRDGRAVEAWPITARARRLTT
jgi:D-serine deaminase-like pyridoxal phosphate-dependent protein